MAQTKGTAKKFDPEAAQAVMNAAAPVEVNTAEVKKTATAVRKAAAKKTTAKKAPAKKAAAPKAPAKKAAAKEAPAAVKTMVAVQFRGKEYTVEDLEKITKDIWVYDLKRDLAEFKEVKIYVKPDECMAYYVVNEQEKGSFFI